MTSEILFEDDWLLAINKPIGILVHRTRMSEDKTSFIQKLRKEFEFPLFAIHRLDRATSGVLLFSKDSDTASDMNQLFAMRKVEKRYLAIVRGWTDDADLIDYALSDKETGKLEALPAQTRYETLGRSEIDAQIGLRYPSARFSLVQIIPVSGRRHQIRKHFSHIRHPIIGDKRHGDVKQNKYFEHEYNIPRMLLHASYLSFTHPRSGELIKIEAPFDDMFLKGLKACNLEKFIPPFNN